MELNSYLSLNSHLKYFIFSSSKRRKTSEVSIMAVLEVSSNCKKVKAIS